MDDFEFHRPVTPFSTPYFKANKRSKDELVKWILNIKDFFRQFSNAIDVPLDDGLLLDDVLGMLL